MNRLVGDLLSLSRVESSARVRPTEEIDMAALSNVKFDRTDAKLLADNYANMCRSARPLADAEC